jgi:pyruvate formate lyase activating enzyme
MATTGIITDIQRFSLHDGPGIRTTVFLKGCNLRCAWCHNPETIGLAAELQAYPDRCIGCGACGQVCPNNVPGAAGLDRAACIVCGRCAAECFAGAFSLVGREVTVDDVLREVLADEPFYARSGGGITISGGEPLMQPAFTRELLSRCREAGLHTAIETNLCFPWATIAAVLPLVDLLMADLKLHDDARHRANTGLSNAPVLANLRHLRDAAIPIIIRTPLLAGVNDDLPELLAMAALLADLPTRQYWEWLPYHPLGLGKARSLGRDEQRFERPSREALRELAAAVRGSGITVRIGDDPEG